MNKYTVWVGGTEVTDVWVTKQQAEEIAEDYKRIGYDDVQIEAKGYEITHAEFVVALCRAISVIHDGFPHLSLDEIWEGEGYSEEEIEAIKNKLGFE